ncbi:hypothetical protein KQH54_01055 [bacterium]|nr:hypothetical protein [bacterium]
MSKRDVKRMGAQRERVLGGVWVLAVILLAGCRGATPTPPPSTDTAVLPTNTPRPTPSPREMQQPTVTETIQPAETIMGPTEPIPLPEFSAVRLLWVTYLDDPQYFQVTLAGWPEDVPEDIVVRVGNLLYICQRLFPEQYPNRVYCWGDAPREGANVLLEVYSDQVTDALVEIPFTVPYIPRPTETPGN